MSLKPAAERLYRRVADADVLDLVPRLLLLLLVISDHVVGEQWHFKLPLRCLAVLGLFVPPLHRSPRLWLALFVVMALKTLDNWWTQDNHLFLATYACLALWLSLRSEDPRGNLALNGKRLIGLSFLFATLWKGLLSPDFMDGSYFHYTFLVDPRFADFGVVFGGLSDGMLQHNDLAERKLAYSLGQVSVAQLQASEGLLPLAKLVTLWTELIEAALAITFLWPWAKGRKLAEVRHGVLLVFASTTYLVATVETFGWILLTLGVAQCRPEQRELRVAYVAVCLLVLAYDIAVPLSLLR